MASFAPFWPQLVELYATGLWGKATETANGKGRESEGQGGATVRAVLSFDMRVTNQSALAPCWPFYWIAVANCCQINPQLSVDESSASSPVLSLSLAECLPLSTLRTVSDSIKMNDLRNKWNVVVNWEVCFVVPYRNTPKREMHTEASLAKGCQGGTCLQFECA